MKLKLVHLTLLLLNHLLFAASDPPIYRNNVAGVSFGDLENFHNRHASFVINHIALDLRSPDRLLICRSNALHIITERKNENLIVGSSEAAGYREGKGSKARFNLISGFVQPTADMILILDYGNYCIRGVNLTTQMTSVYAGMCRLAGNRDGMRLGESRLTNPHSMVKSILENNTFYITDENAHAIKVLRGNDVSTLVAGYPITLPRGLVIDQYNPAILYVVSDQWIVKVHIYAISNRYGRLNSALSSGFVDGDLSNAQFNNPQGIIQVTNNLFAVADLGNNRVRLIDTLSSTVTSVCTGVNGEHNGVISECMITEPKSLLVLEDGIVVAERAELKILRIRNGSVIPPRQVTEPNLESESAGDTDVIPHTTTPARNLSEKELVIVICIPITVGATVVALLVAVLAFRKRRECPADCRNPMVNCFDCRNRQPNFDREQVSEAQPAVDYLIDLNDPQPAQPRAPTANTSLAASTAVATTATAAATSTATTAITIATATNASKTTAAEITVKKKNVDSADAINEAFISSET